MATSFVALNLAQKIVIGGIIGTCGGVFFLNGASLSQQVPTRGYHPQQGSQPLVGLPAFLKNVWTPKFVQEHLVLRRKNIEEGRWYTLLTSGLNHFTLPHLIMNMGGFWSMGIPLISRIGAPTFLTIWVTSGIFCGFASIISINRRLKSALSQPATRETRNEVARLANTGFVGASGSIFGLFAATAMINPYSRLKLLFIPYYFPARILLGLLFVGSVIADFNGWMPGIGHWGHIGGMVVGTATGYILERAGLVRAPISIAALLALSPLRVTSIQRWRKNRNTMLLRSSSLERTSQVLNGTQEWKCIYHGPFLPVSLHHSSALHILRPKAIEYIKLLEKTLPNTLEVALPTS